MKISDNCFAVTGLYYTDPWSVNAGFAAGDAITAVIDSGSNTASAQTIYGYAKSVRPDNQMILINTERHLDHIGGNGYFFGNGVCIYGHSAIKRTQDEFIALLQDINDGINDEERKENNEGCIAFKNTRIVNPDRMLDNDAEFDLGGISIQILMTPGHTKSNLSVYQKDERVLFCGDCIAADFMPNLGEGNPDDWKIWLTSLEKIRKLNPGIIVPGHGNVIIGKTEIDREISRISDIIYHAINTLK